MIVSCEHGGNEIPADYADLFASPGAKADLRSHRGYDPGALRAAEYIADHFETPLIASTTTRLLVDLNRSEDNDGLLSKYSRGLGADARERLLEQLYRPYRRRVYDAVAALIDAGRVAVHLSIHTFTPRFRGTRRSVDIGILFDPARSLESDLAGRWCADLQSRLPRSRARANEPYLGTDDGLTTWLRTQFTAEKYIGIEIEIANSFAKKSSERQKALLNALVQSRSGSTGQSNKFLSGGTGPTL